MSIFLNVFSNLYYDYDCPYKFLYFYLQLYRTNKKCAALHYVFIFFYQLLVVVINKIVYCFFEINLCYCWNQFVLLSKSIWVVVEINLCYCRRRFVLLSKSICVLVESNFRYCRKPFLQQFTDSAIYHSLLPNSFPMVNPICPNRGFQRLPTR